MSQEKYITSSGIEIKEVYTQAQAQIEAPGEFPFTRGIQKDMYRTQLLHRKNAHWQKQLTR